jgi:hypothetical protein
MDRVAQALTKYAPSDITIVPKEQDADLVFIHVIGWPETAAARFDWTSLCHGFWSRIPR